MNSPRFKKQPQPTGDYTIKLRGSDYKGIMSALNTLEGHEDSKVVQAARKVKTTIRLNASEDWRF